VVMLFASIPYNILFWTRLGATPGKLALGLRVVADDGTNPSMRAAVMRYIGYWLSYLGLGIGFITIAYDPRRQGWHDKLAHTFVVDRNSSIVPRNTDSGVSAPPASAAHAPPEVLSTPPI